MLKKINFQDSSTIIHFFTREQGKIAVIAKGSRQLKSQFRGYLEPLNLLDIIYYEKSTRDVQTLSKADLIKNFVVNLKDIQATYFSLAILEVLDKIIHQNEENQALFDLTVKALKYIDKNSSEPETGFIVFLFGAIKILGYRMDLNHCNFCGRDLKNFYFDMKVPQPVCFNCSYHHFEEITADQLVWLKSVDNLDFVQEIPPIKQSQKSARIVAFLLAYAGMYFDFQPKLNSLEMLKYLN